MSSDRLDDQLRQSHDAILADFQETILPGLTQKVLEGIDDLERRKRPRTSEQSPLEYLAAPEAARAAARRRAARKAAPRRTGNEPAVPVLFPVGEATPGFEIGWEHRRGIASYDIFVTTPSVEHAVTDLPARPEKVAFCAYLGRPAELMVLRTGSDPRFAPLRNAEAGLWEVRVVARDARGRELAEDSTCFQVVPESKPARGAAAAPSLRGFAREMARAQRTASSGARDRQIVQLLDVTVRAWVGELKPPERGASADAETCLRELDERAGSGRLTGRAELVRQTLRRLLPLRELYARRAPQAGK